jgi:hemerythrin-like metal-binding protein
MPLIAWNDSYKTGDATVDGQHQELFRMVNTLHDAIISGKGKEVVQPTLDGLAKYVGTHFGHEEKLMQAKDYPGFAVHKAKHEDLTKQALKIIEDYRTGKTQLTISLSRFLADWLRTHIDIEDKAMIKHCQKPA